MDFSHHHLWWHWRYVGLEGLSMNVIFIVRKHRRTSYYNSGYYEPFLIHSSHESQIEAKDEAARKNKTSKRFYFSVQKLNIGAIK